MCIVDPRDPFAVQKSQQQKRSEQNKMKYDEDKNKKLANSKWAEEWKQNKTKQTSNLKGARRMYRST